MSIIKHIPNSITCCNLISGCIATHFAFLGMLEWSLLWIVIGAIFDFFDGMAARLLHVSSPIGKELDSLADVITFGVAPSTMLFFMLSITDVPSFLFPIQNHIPYLAFVMAAFSALRLAKFNLDTRQTTSFIGLPTPANALFWGSFLCGTAIKTEASPSLFYMLIILLALSCWLLLAEIPMFALKFKHWGWKDNEVKYIFVLSCIPLLIIFHISAIAIIIAWYMILSVGVNLTKKQQQ